VAKGRLDQRAQRVQQGQRPTANVRLEQNGATDHLELTAVIGHQGQKAQIDQKDPSVQKHPLVQKDPIALNVPIGQIALRDPKGRKELFARTDPAGASVQLGQRAEKDDHIATVLKKPSGRQFQPLAEMHRPKDARQLRKSLPVLVLEFKTTMSLDSVTRLLIRATISKRMMVTLKSIPTRLPRGMRPSERDVQKGAAAADGVQKVRAATAKTRRLILETQRTNGTTMIQLTSSARTVEFRHGRTRSERW